MSSERIIEIMEEEILEDLKANPQKLKNMGKVIVAVDIIDLPDGKWVFNLQKEPTIKRTKKGDADLTVRVASADFINLYEKKLDAQKAFFSGKIKIEGNLGLALKLKNLF